MTAPLPTSVDPAQKFLGRLYAPDPRDRNYPLEKKVLAMTRAELKRRTQAPAKAVTLDQGPTPRCTMFSLAHCLGASPSRYRGDPLGQLQVEVDGSPDCYHWSRRHDEWPGEDYAGTSVRAALEYARKRGLIAEYLWARDISEAKDYISREGSSPLQAGTDWYAGMTAPTWNSKRKIWIAEPNGALQGGHAYCVLWTPTAKSSPLYGFWKCQQSWGIPGTTNAFPWSDGEGIFYVPDDVMNYLVFQANGELGSFTEVR